METQAQNTQTVIAQFYAKKYKNLVNSMAFRLNRGTNTIEDKIQECILIILESEKEFDSVEKLEQYIRISISTRTYNDTKRAQKYANVSINVSDIEGLDNTHLAGCDYINEYENDIALYEAQKTKRIESIRTISTSKDAVFVEKLSKLYKEGYKYKEMAEILGVNITNIQYHAAKLIKAGVLAPRKEI